MNHTVTRAATLLCTLLAGCHLGPRGTSDLPVVDSLFTEGHAAFRLQTDQLNEASGLAASRQHPGHWWAHNDSGDGPSLYLFDSTGQLATRLTLEEKYNHDWEDMALAPGADSTTYIYVADIGNNFAEEAYMVKIYRLREPELSQAHEQLVAKGDFERRLYRYPDGARDAEAFMAIPFTDDFLIVSKREPEVQLYAGSFGPAADEPTLLTQLGTLPLTWITAGDISPDGQELLLKSYSEVYYWRKQPGHQWQEVLLNEPPVRLPYTREPQGEAVGWLPDGSGYATLSERATNVLAAQLKLYERK